MYTKCMNDNKNGFRPFPKRPFSGLAYWCLGLPKGVAEQPQIRRCAQIFQCLRNQNSVLFFKTLRSMPLLPAMFVFSIYGKYMRVSGLALMVKLDDPKKQPNLLSLQELAR